MDREWICYIEDTTLNGYYFKNSKNQFMFIYADVYRNLKRDKTIHQFINDNGEVSIELDDERSIEFIITKVSKDDQGIILDHKLSQVLSQCISLWLAETRVKTDKLKLTDDELFMYITTSVSSQPKYFNHRSGSIINNNTMYDIANTPMGICPTGILIKRIEHNKMDVSGATVYLTYKPSVVSINKLIKLGIAYIVYKYDNGIKTNLPDCVYKFKGRTQQKVI